MAQQPAGAVPTFSDIDVDDARAVVEAALARGGGWLSPVEIGDLFAAAGISVAKSRFVSTLDDALECRREALATRSRSKPPDQRLFTRPK